MKVLSLNEVSIIHYVELTDAGWWQQAIERCVLAQLRLLGVPAPKQQLKKEIQKGFGLSIKGQELSQALAKLTEVGATVRLNDDRYALSQTKSQQLDEAEKESVDCEEKTRARFIDGAQKISPHLASEEVWDKFLQHFLIPLVSNEGARTYELFVRARKISPLDSYFDIFLKQFPSSQHADLRNVVYDFFSDDDIHTRRFLLSYLDAYFLLSASGLPRPILNSLIASSGATGEFVLSVDTNFVFSILGLHDNPSNEAADDLMELARSDLDNLNIEFVITEDVLQETREALDYHSRRLGNTEYPPNIAEALSSQSEISGIYRKFFERVRTASQAISTEDYFRPYKEGLARLLASNGIAILREEVSRPHKLSYSILEDIESQTRFEGERFGERAKTELQITRDVTHWHFVQELRHKTHGLQSPFTVKYWIVTVDYRFLSFDRYKTNQQRYALPVCIHPTQLIQMLRFFVPRSVQFEKTLLGVVKMPVLSREFDTEAEKVSLRIARRLSRHEAIGDIDVGVIAGIVADENLRDRIRQASSEEEVDRAINDSLARRLRAYEIRLQRQDGEIISLQREVDLLKKAVTVSNMRVLQQESQEQVGRVQNDEVSPETDEELRILKDELISMRKSIERSKFLLRLLVGVAVTLIGIASVVVLTLFGNWSWLDDHPHELGIVLSGCGVFAALGWAIADNKRRNYALGGLLLGIVLGLIQII